MAEERARHSRAGDRFSDSGGPLSPPFVVASPHPCSCPPAIPSWSRASLHLLPSAHHSSFRFFRSSCPELVVDQYGYTPHPSILPSSSPAHPPSSPLSHLRSPLPLHPTQLLPVPLLSRRHPLRSARLVRHGANLSNTASFFVIGFLTWSFFPGPLLRPSLTCTRPRLDAMAVFRRLSPRGGAMSSPSLHLRVARPYRPSASLCDGPNLPSAPSPSAYMCIAHHTFALPCARVARP
ncbi:hypothetical protein B0H14DRAFT_1475545 [Mycena olivaceomarginata]|nr:hypothetical protein B0H14DRAFT_1475545 [Mycena olivaceomarginata]